MIKSISIKNVKGIEDRTFEFENPDMRPNRVHVLIAPNGFGKSSIATAFDKLKKNSLRVKGSDAYNRDDTRKPELVLTVQNDTETLSLTANTERNDLSGEFDTFVIRALGRPNARQSRNAAGFSFSVPEMVIDPIAICKIPEKTLISYSVKEVRTQFGSNGKALPNISGHVANLDLLEAFHTSEYGRKSIQVRAQKRIAAITAKIKTYKGTKEEIYQKIEETLIPEMEVIDELNNASSLFDDLPSRPEKLLAAIQLIEIHKSAPKLIRKTCEWLTYERQLKRIKGLLKACNSNRHWLTLSIKASDNRLTISFPKPELMSNGQRDLLSFVAQILSFEHNLKKKKAILIIDEIFDYLDSSNLIACQYFLSKLIAFQKNQGKELFPLILTHLDPCVFNSFVFNRKLQKNHYLDKDTEVDRKKGLYKIIQRRSHDSAFEDIFAKYFAHHCLEDCDEKNLFQAKGLKTNWGCSRTFKVYCEGEAEKYISEEPTEIDYLAVCLHVRVSIEKFACDQLSSEKKITFTEDIRRTIPKLDFAIENGADVPEVHYLLASLYNTALHPISSSSDFASPVISKLRNNNIKEMIRDALSVASASGT